MTVRQAEYLEWIGNFIRENNRSPSFLEIRYGLNLASIASVHKMIGGLVRRGAVTYQRSVARSIAIVGPEAGGCPSCARLKKELMVAYEIIAQVKREKML